MFLRMLRKIISIFSPIILAIVTITMALNLIKIAKESNHLRSTLERSQNNYEYLINYTNKVLNINILSGQRFEILIDFSKNLFEDKILDPKCNDTLNVIYFGGKSCLTCVDEILASIINQNKNNFLVLTSHPNVEYVNSKIRVYKNKLKIKTISPHNELCSAFSNNIGFFKSTSNGRIYSPIIYSQIREVLKRIGNQYDIDLMSK